MLPKWLQLTIVATAAIAIIMAFQFGPSRGKTEPQPAEPAVPAGSFRPTEAQWAGLKTALVQQRTFRTEQVTDGKIAVDDDRTTPVFSPYSGRVTKLFAKAGDEVQRGAPLFALEASEFVQGENDLVAAAAALETARSQLRLAETNEKRQHDLYKAQGAALKDWQQAQSDLTSAQGNSRSAETALAAVRNRLRILGKSDREIDAIQSARVFNPEVVVGAPIEGTVTQRQIGLGQYIQSGSGNPVFTIGDLSVVWLVANVRETDVPAMRVGQPVEVRVLAYPGRVFRAKLTYVGSSVDPTTRRLPVRAEVENPDQLLKAEMFASFTIIVGQDVAAPAVPEGAVIYDGETARVWVAGPSHTLTARTIKPGRTQDGLIEVLSGLRPGERIVTSGTIFVDRAASGD